MAERDADAGGAAPVPRPGDPGERHAHAMAYIRAKVDELLAVLGTAPLRPEELDDETLIGLDPIGIVAGAFRQVLNHLNLTNEQLRFAREELQAIFDSAGLGIMVIDPERRILACNAKFREQVGAGAADLTGRPCREVVCLRDHRELSCPFVATLTAGTACRSTDWVLVGRHYDVVSTAVHNQAGQVIAAVLVYADITERILADQALRHSEERYRDLFENTSDLILCARPDGTLEYVNASWCATLGYSREEAAGLTLFDLLHPTCDAGCRERFEALLRGEAGGRVRTAFLSQQGRTVVLEGDLNLMRDGGRTVGIRAILRNVTEREALEEELRKREKLESVGVLAGGIAHDFNNLLTAVLGNISLAQAVASPDDPVQERLAEAEKATLAARGLTQQLLTFSHGGSPIKRLTAIGQLVREHTVFACRGSNVDCRVEAQPGLWGAEVDEGQLGQVVHNLVLNAVQAMDCGGTVRVGLANVTVGPGDDPLLPRGRWVRISVRDTGCGIPREHLQQMFDPYFTTKPGGSGLGLAVCYAIVKKHGGQILVTSAPGEGTVFDVYLPAATSAAPAAEPPAISARPGRGRVLVMDDEPLVVEIAGAMLGQLGYEFASAPNGKAAIALYEQARAQGRPFEAVIMDLTVPGGMGGKEAIRELLTLDPGARVLVSSGYSNDPVMACHAEHGFCGVIVKPYRMADLAAALQAATQSAAPAP